MDAASVWANIGKKGTIPDINLISKPIWKMLLKASEVQEATESSDTSRRFERNTLKKIYQVEGVCMLHASLSLSQIKMFLSPFSGLSSLT